MYEVGIFTNGRGWQNWNINDYETAREAYSKACDLCRVIGSSRVALWSAETYTVLAELCLEGD